MPKKLLLAEDSLTIRKVFELALSRSDVAITAVDNGEDAVRLAGQVLPDLVVADLTLPGKNGFAVASELRAMEKTEKIPVLILSGTLVPLDEARFKASGAKGVLFKPFESRELLETIERVLREETPVSESGKAQGAPPPADERWDFSDVMDEVEAEAGKSPVTPAPETGEGLLPGAILPGGAKASPALNEFDVSIDEIEGSVPDVFASPAPPPPEPKVQHLDPGFPIDSPPPVTDLSPALDDVEEVEEIEHLEEVEVPLPPPDAAATEMPASIRILPAGTAYPVAEEPTPVVEAPIPAAEERISAAEVPIPAVEVPIPAVEEPVQVQVVEEPVQVAAEVISVPPPSAVAEPATGSLPGDVELRDLFAGRAAEIFRTVASEAVEKVMWEMTDRLAAEFSAKLRESVEAVAWEVIPSTAEALIREEIARIRGLAGKPSP